MSCAGGPDIVQDGLVLCLDAGNSKSYSGSGSIWTDLSGNDNNGTLTNGPTFNSNNKGGIRFDGIDDMVNCGQKSTLNLVSNFTLDIWFNALGVGGGSFGRFFDKSGTVSLNTLSFLIDNSNVTNGIQVSINNSNQHNVANCVTFGANTNFTLTITNRSSFYKNGSFVSTSASTFTVPDNSTLDLYIGNRRDGARTFNGTIYCAKVYNRVLSPTEILQNYNALKGRFKLT